MKFFELLRGAKARQPSGTRRYVVQVVFCPLTGPIPDSRTTYDYEWALATPPRVGDRVFVRGGDGRHAEAAITSVGEAVSKTRVLDLAPVYRVATDEDMREATAAEERARARADEEERAWLRVMRKAAGLPTPGRVSAKLPERFPSVPPATGTASPEKANEYGRAWWRAYKRAEERGHDSEEVQAFRSLAHRWYAIRDKG
ncbi:hypothetical protein GCM10023351_19000 [Microbacterium gilvum]|uniref:ASCH domain-containing protein n=1 Tax=Microbacterium gilvum TaxID=1336204 RepID=A0ABP9A6N0_9MICO